MSQIPMATPVGTSRGASKISCKRQSTLPQKRPQSIIPTPPSVQPTIASRPPARALPTCSCTSNPPTPPSTAKYNARRASPVATPKGSTTRLSNGSLTPNSVHSRASSTTSQNSTPSITTPPAPRKQRPKPSGHEIHGTRSDPTSLFMDAHIGEHCIKGALVHKLACGHKVITVKVEECASNCVRPLAKHLQEHSNPATEEAFVCSACIEQHVQSHREAKRALFAQTFKMTEQRMISFPHGWLETQREYWEKVWENDIAMERDAFALWGRKCAHFGDHVVVVMRLGKEKSRSDAVPIRTMRNLKAGRVPNEKTSGSFCHRGSRIQCWSNRKIKRQEG